MTQPGEYPFYTIHDLENKPHGSYTVYAIRIDSDDGRAYKALSTHAERLAFMRERAHDSWNAVQADSAFLEDNVAGKTYVIKMDTPEYEGLQKMLMEDGGCWPEGTREFEDMVRYYKEHATEIEEAPVGCCDREA